MKYLLIARHLTNHNHCTKATSGRDRW